MPVEECDKLFLECPLPVVFALVIDVCARVVDLRYADAERAVAHLPGEILVIGKGLVYPFRGVGLDELHRLGDVERRGQRDQKMNMILDTADRKSVGVDFARYAAQVGVEVFFEGMIDVRSPILGAEDAMEQRAGK